VAVFTIITYILLNKTMQPTTTNTAITNSSMNPKK
jgi:hypothetical protein